MKRSFAYAAAEAQHRIESNHGELFDVCARKHGGNPESIEAHKTIRGALPALREAVYHQIKESGEYGRTVDEYCAMWDETPNAISGRFSELARDGRIVKIGRRKTRSGCSASVWKAV